MMFCEARPFQNSDDPSVHRVFRGKEHVHLMGDDEYELRMFAGRIGMKVAWLQRDRFGIAHFDCTGKYLKAVQESEFVRKLDRREFVEEWKKLRAAVIEKIQANMESR